MPLKTAPDSPAIQKIKNKINTMNTTKLTTMTAAFSAVLLLNAPGLFAQDPSPAPSAAPSAAPSTSPAAATSPMAGQDQRGGRRNFNPEEARKWFNDRIKTGLKVSDDEWAVIQPLLEKVQNLQFSERAMPGSFGGFSRRQRGDEASAKPSPAGGENNRRAARPASPEAEALRTTLESESSSTEDIKAKLQALRESRQKNATELAQAREDLKKVLTLKQEATLVMMGILE